MVGFSRPAIAQRSLNSSLDSLTSRMVVEQWNMSEGLPQSTVLRVATDDKGFVWGATFAGLFRFDGRRVAALTDDDLPTLQGVAATAVASGRAGTIIVGTNRGQVLILRDGRLVETLPPPPFPSGLTINELHVDQLGVIWVRASYLVASYSKGRWTAEPTDLVNGTQFGETTSGDVVFAGARGLVRGRPGQMRFDPRGPKVPFTGERQALFVDALDRVWIGGGTLQVFDERRSHLIPDVRGIVTTITADANGTVWIGTLKALYRVERATAPTSALRAELVSEFTVGVLSVTRTWDNLLAVGTRGGGLVVLREKPVQVMPLRGANDQQVTTVLADRTGGLWVTGGCTDLFRVAPDWSRYLDTLTRFDGRGCVRSAAQDRRGRLWIGTDGMIRRRDGSHRYDNWPLPLEKGEGVLARPLLAVGDTMFVGLSDGRIGRIGPDDRLTFEPRWSTATGLAIESMAASRDGTIWVGQFGRVTAWRGSTRQTFGRVHGVPQAVPRVLYPDVGGTWAGTYGGGLVFVEVRGDAGRARTLPLRDPTVSGMVRDDLGRMWMPGNRGITIVDYQAMRAWVNDSLARPDFVTLSSSDGVPEGNFGSPAAVRLTSGEIITSSIEGAVRSTAIGTPQGITPPLIIEEVRTVARTISPDSATVQLSAGERLIAMMLSMPTFRFADKAQFRYRVLDRDPEWILLDDSRRVPLSRLEAGMHEIQVEGRVPGGDWRAAPVLRVVVAPYWHERTSLRVLVIAALIGLGVTFVLQRRRAARAEARSLEVEVQARQRALEQAEQHQRELTQIGRVAVAGELTASLSHELGQPLAAIVNNAEVARRLAERLPSAPGGSTNELDIVLRDVVLQGQRASQVVREFRRFLRREPSAPSRLNVAEIVDSVVMLMRQEFNAAGVVLRVYRPAAMPALYCERVLMQQVLVNLLQNGLEAVRETGTRDGTVLLRVRRVGEGIRFSVVDSGLGFPASIRATAFEPFVTGRVHGMGMGLAIVRRIVESHGGRVAIGKLPSAGAVVSVWCPLGSAAELNGADRLLPEQVTPSVSRASLAASQAATSTAAARANASAPSRGHEVSA